ncbi:PREDICTED: BURP domain protein RD22-like [Nelumbo nucifera]|uniref:BURP domain protein RD22-like n=2 Tax=Nelumbo nucifera TaxID=4432 RepID=A0A1U8B614_NELNU|nr:PREDICTED: BURP domain protein RD22-like [Nelumbo nucifera]DAD30137.1 TPA_asm: hypothetical protein HUJ06_031605 [Nelumbo nucifera]
MGFPFLPIIAFLVHATVAVSHADLLPSEVYWKSVSNAPMPKSIRDLLRPDGNLKPTSRSNVNAVLQPDDNVAYGFNVNYGNSHGFNLNYRDLHGSGVGMETVFHPDDNVAYGFNVNYGNSHGSNVNYAKSLASKDKFHLDPNVAYYFLDESLRQGTKMNLDITGTRNRATFLPRQVADSIPFSSNKLPEILRRFRVKQHSVAAEAMEETIKVCEAPAQDGENKHCATSLESMIDFSTSKLGKRIWAKSAEVDNGGKKILKQQYMIGSGLQKMVDNPVVCHSLNYPYSVYYCHLIQRTRSYLVPLVGANGVKAKAIAVCHTDTSKWNPQHLAFRLLKVKPGTVPICHLLREDTIAWFPSQKLK